MKKPTYDFTTSVRGLRLQYAANACLNHIETYTVPQYGDKPNDQLCEMTVQDMAHNIKRYMNRVGSNSRGIKESQRDMLKVMHYAAEMYLLLRDIETQELPYDHADAS